jgi:hypothetical protein
LRPYNISGHSAKLNFCGTEPYKAAVGDLTLSAIKRHSPASAIRPQKTVTGMLTTAYLLAGALSLLPFDFSVVA